jgi:predicted nucleotidyltransferase
MNLNPEYENKYLSLLKKIIMDETQHDASTIFLFGSRASGRERFGSDYDIGITGMDKNTFEKMKYSILDKIERSRFSNNLTPLISCLQGRHNTPVSEGRDPVAG